MLHAGGRLRWRGSAPEAARRLALQHHPCAAHVPSSRRPLSRIDARPPSTLHLDAALHLHQHSVPPSLDEARTLAEYEHWEHECCVVTSAKSCNSPPLRGVASFARSHSPTSGWSPSSSLVIGRGGITTTSFTSSSGASGLPAARAGAMAATTSAGRQSAAAARARLLL